MDTAATILRNIFLFEGVTEAVKAAMAEPVTVFEKGTLIYSETDYRRALGIVLSGTAKAEPAPKASTAGAADTGVLLQVFAPGSVFGAAALFGAPAQYVSRIRATGRCRVLFLDEAVLRRLFAAYPQTAVNYIAFLSSRVRFLSGKIALLAQSDTESRVYGYLTAACDGQGCLTDTNMSRLARTLGMGRTSLYRALDALERKQFIVRKDGKVTVIV